MKYICTGCKKEIDVDFDLSGYLHKDTVCKGRWQIIKELEKTELEKDKKEV